MAPKQHSFTVSLLLHLTPGIIILTCIFVFSQPAIVRQFGIDIQLGPLFGYLMGLLLGLLPVQLGILLYVGKRQTGTWGLREVIGYLEPSSLRQYMVLIPVFLIYNVLLFVVVAPRIQPFIVKTLFPWYPEEYNFQLFMQVVMQNPATFSRYGSIHILLVLYVVLSGILGPIVEELYFRGYLLPRMEQYAQKWSPLINTVLFSIYHFFSPWENLIRIVGLFPVYYTVWRKKDIRYGIATHVTLNTLGGIAFLIVLLR